MNLLSGIEFIQQQGDRGRALGKETKLNRLAGEAYGAAPMARPEILQQAVSTDANAGLALGKALDSDEDRRNQTMANMARTLVSAPQQARAGLYQQMLPSLQRFGLSNLPPAYDDASGPMIDETANAIVQASLGGERGNVQSTRVGADGYYYTVDRSGRWTNSGIKADPNAQVVEGAGGFYNIDKRANTAAPVQLGGSPAAAPPQGPVMSQVSYATEDGMPIPPEEQQFAQQAFAAASRGEDFNVPVGGALPQTMPPASAPSQLQAKGPDQTELRRLQLAEEANERAAEAARLAAYDRSRGNAPAGFRFRADGSLEPIPGGPKPAGAAASEDERKAAAWLAQSRNAYQNMVGVLNEDSDADEPGFLETYLPSEELANRSRSGTRQRYVQAASSLGEALLRAATGAGVNRDEAIQKTKELTPQRGDSPEVKRQKMAAIPVYLDALEKRAGRAVPQQPAPEVPPAAQPAAGPQGNRQQEVMKALNDARDAIRAGAPREAVKQRLIEMGYLKSAERL